MALGVLRNTPLLMQLFMVYFVAAPALGMGPFAAAVLSPRSLRGRVHCGNLPRRRHGRARGQWEAALSSACPWAWRRGWSLFRRPSGRDCPRWPDNLFRIIKDTSLVSAIAVADLTMRTRVVITDTFLSFELWLLAAAVYLVLTSLVSIPARLLERKEHS